LAKKIRDGEITAEEKKKFKLKRQIVYTMNEEDPYSRRNEDNNQN